MSKVTTTPVHYTTTAIALHWILGLAIFATFCVGFYTADLPFSPQKLKLLNWHKWAGVSILLLSVVRLLWRITHRPPGLPSDVTRAMPAWQHLAHSLTHTGLYVLFFAVPLIGWAYSSAAGFPIVLFGQIPLPDFVSPDKALADLIKPWHEASAWLMAALVALHVAGALKHQVIDRDSLLRRMLPVAG
jgi:cytochrome b561